jgi:hypothetical protein
MSPGRGSTPRRTDRLTVGRNGTLTLTLTLGIEPLFLGHPEQQQETGQK